MNPALIVAALLFLSQGGSGKGPLNMLQLPGLGIGKLGIPPIKDPGYFDTFRMELLLDRLHNMTNTLEKVNHLNQMRGVPMNRDNSIDRIQESLEAVRGLMYNNKSSRKIDTLSNTLSGVKRIGDMQGIMTNMGPILSMLSNQDDK
jgi:hypothetical protein